MNIEELNEVKKILDKAKVRNPRWILLNGELIYLSFWSRIKLFFKRIKIIEL